LGLSEEDGSLRNITPSLPTYTCHSLLPALPVRTDCLYPCTLGIRVSAPFFGVFCLSHRFLTFSFSCTPQFSISSTPLISVRLQSPTSVLDPPPPPPPVTCCSSLVTFFFPGGTPHSRFLPPFSEFPHFSFWLTPLVLQHPAFNLSLAIFSHKRPHFTCRFVCHRSWSHFWKYAHYLPFRPPDTFGFFFRLLVHQAGSGGRDSPLLGNPLNLIEQCRPYSLLFFSQVYDLVFFFSQPLGSFFPA